MFCRGRYQRARKIQEGNFLLGWESEKTSWRRQCLSCHGAERMGRILIDRNEGRVGHSLHRQWLELRHEGRGEIKLMYLNKKVEIKK